MERADEVPLTTASVLYAGGSELIRHAYFPLAGIVSLVSLIEKRPMIEVGRVGYEGMIGLPLALGLRRSPFQAVVQNSGTAMRLSHRAFATIMRESAPLRILLQKFTHVSIAQLGSTANCLGSHRLAARLARCLLMTQDRARTEEFEVTQQYLASVLGVRRSGVSTAARALQRQEVIRYARGKISIMSRRGLEAAACPCYAIDINSHRALLQ